ISERYALIHRLQPGCLVGNNHHLPPKDGEDFQAFEKDLPGQNTAGFSGTSKIGTLPLETCETMNNTWGYAITDDKYKSPEDLIRLLVKAAGNNANLLLNVGPQPNGELPAVALERMKTVGAWLREYGPTVYGTRGGPVKPHDWGVTTAREGKVFVHILKYDDAALFLPLTGVKVKKAVEFKGRTPLKFTQDADGVLLRLPAGRDAVDYVVELEVQ
ncbi:MAG: alpha-L-fucosidase, partial [Rikenellaceae bacterium]|nr:alpha-L-fucosidase [Rikenellaceae bacterium]